MTANYLIFLDEFKGRKFDTTYTIIRRERVDMIDSSLYCNDTTISEIEMVKAIKIKPLIKLIDNKEIKEINKIDSLIETNNDVIQYKQEIEIKKENIIKFENKNVNNMGQNLLNISVLFATMSYIAISYTAWISFYKEIKMLFK
jgi:hypothetical protein